MTRNSCKVCTLIAEYGLRPPGADTGLYDDYLVARWTGSAGYEAQGYKTLAERFNKELIQRILQREGEPTPDHRVSSIYRALQSDDKYTLREVKEDLKRVGAEIHTIEVAHHTFENLEDQFVTTSTIRRHLNDCLNATKETKPSRSNSTWELSQIDYNKNLLLENIEDALTSLSKKHDIPEIKEGDTSVEISISCPHEGCNIKANFETVIDRGYLCPDHGQPSNTPAEPVNNDDLSPESSPLSR